MKRNLLIIFALLITLFLTDRYIRPGMESAGEGKVKEETRINREELKVEDYEYFLLTSARSSELYASTNF